MMETAGADQYVSIIKSILDLGPIGLVLIMGYFAKQQVDKTLDQYRSDMVEMRRMYENNVELLRVTQSLAVDLKDILVMNTTAMTKLVEKIEREVCS